MAPARTGASSALPGSILLVVHDFIARSPDELSLAKGDRIELIERCGFAFETCVRKKLL
jgi:hypothetical protein